MTPDNFDEGILAVRDRVDDWDGGIGELDDSEEEVGNRFNPQPVKEDGLLFDIEIE